MPACTNACGSQSEANGSRSKPSERSDAPVIFCSEDVPKLAHKTSQDLHIRNAKDYIYLTIYSYVRDPALV